MSDARTGVETYFVWVAALGFGEAVESLPLVATNAKQFDDPSYRLAYKLSLSETDMMLCRHISKKGYSHRTYWPPVHSPHGMKAVFAAL